MKMRKAGIVVGFVLMLLTAGTGCSDRPRARQNDDPKLITFSSCPGLPGPALPVSVSAITSDPSSLDGRKLSVTGYFCAGFELSGVFGTQGCDAPAQSGLWVEGVPVDLEFNGEKVEIVGAFGSSRSGHLGQWPGTLCAQSIRLIDPEAAFKRLQTSGVPGS
ncbi:MULTISPECIES: hypothetical protein [Stenotrophomonas]|uniref:hypothetical protein n=1 Tax=Stenotrophomonas TaxID=40323 RepID=UPI00114CE2D4|nr:MULTISPECIES: hypothetical protein [Stenotrophomonas]